MTTKASIEKQLKQHFQPLHLEVIDESAKHATHAEARKSGGGHFQVTIVSAAFVGKTLLERHRAVNQVLGEELKQSIHALALKTLTPEEWQQSGS